MRLQHWITTVLGLVVIFVGHHNVSAQFYDPTRVEPADGMNLTEPDAPPTRLFRTSGAPPVFRQASYTDLAGEPAEFMNAYGESIPGRHAISLGPNGEPGMPPGFQPWPTISAFENRFDEHYIDNGTWMHNVNNSPRRYYFNADVLITKFRAPKNSRIGSDKVNGNIWFQGLPNVHLYFPHGPVETRGQTLRGDPSEPSENLFEGAFRNWETTPGVRLRWGFTDPDQQGFEVGGFWSNEWQDVQLYGDPNATEKDLSTLRNTNPGLILDDGSGNLANVFSHVNALYDKNVVISYTISSYGANFTRLMTPVVKKSILKVRPFYGARYLGIKEKFQFTGTGAGLTYFTQFPPGIGPNPADPLNIPVVVVVPPFEGILRSDVDSNLAGPEIGFRTDLGGDKFLIQTDSRFALMGNRERITVASRGLGNHLGPNFDPNFSTVEKETHTHLSPVFEQSVTAEMNLIPLLPVLKRMHIFEKARFRAGYTFLVVGELARPTDVIVYLAPPIYPKIKVDRTNWYMGSWTFGIDWRY